jgi:basic amino acid/polyamine antiporter, APA family
MTVVQTGAIAAVAFVFGDYAQQILPLGDDRAGDLRRARRARAHGAQPRRHAAGKNAAEGAERGAHDRARGDRPGGADSPGEETRPPSEPGPAAFGLAMIFVLLTYGGWNEAAYIAGEVRDARRNMLRILVVGILVITALYLLVNLGYLNAALGLGGMRDSPAVAADVLRSRRARAAPRRSPSSSASRR